MFQRCVLTMFFATMGGAARGHDSWLLAFPVVVPSGGTISLEFATGETFPISEHATDPQRVAEWVYLEAGVKRKVESAALVNKSLTASARVGTPGLAVIAIALKPRFIEIEAERFEEYLRDEGATAALTHRRASRTSGLPGREYYTKLAKTFVCVGDPEACGAADADFARVVGHPLEIVPQTNPAIWKHGDTVDVRVLWHGKPAVGLRVSSGHDGLPEHTFVEHVSTDEDGIARMTLSGAAAHWFVRAHRIELLDPPAHRAGADQPAADWESFFSSLSFVIRVPHHFPNPEPGELPKRPDIRSDPGNP